MRKLKRYWFVFEKASEPTPLNLGCGVSAFTYDDALEMLQEQVFKRGEMPVIVECIENVDISLLDKGHVLPNIGMVAVRGIWFPPGY
jgi:hypothetical protein